MAVDARIKHCDRVKGSLKSKNKDSNYAKGGVKKKPVSLKNQIRGIERLLRKEGLDARIRKKEEAKLQELKFAIDEHKRAEKERIYAVRYHKVRFFERIKLERGIRKVERQLAEAREKGTEAPPALVERLACLLDDLQYVVHFPKGEKYVSILRDVEEPAAQAALMAERERLRALVHKQQAEIAIVTEADEGAALLARQRRAVQQLAEEHVANVPPEGPSKEHEDEDDFFTPDDSGKSASEGEQLHSVPRSSKPDHGAAKQRKAQGPATAPAAHAAEKIRSGAAAGTSAAPSAKHNRGEMTQAAGIGAGVHLEGDIADDDDFFLQSGASDNDSSDGDDEQDGDVGPTVPPVQHGTGAPSGAEHRLQHTGGVGRQALAGMESVQKHTGSSGQKRRGAAGVQVHASQKKGRGVDRERPAKKHVIPAGGPWRPKAASGEQRVQFKGKPKGAAGRGKRRADAAPAAKQPLRTRAEGGRKRQKAK